MSDVRSAAVAETPATEPMASQQDETKPDEISQVEPSTAAPAVESSKPTETDAITETKDESAAVEEKKDEAATEKPVEPITEGVLALKGPGFLK